MAIQAPSFSNTLGTGGGALAALAVGLLAHFGYLAATAAFLGMPEATVTTMAITGIGLLANYGITHYAEVAKLNDAVATWWPQSQASFPAQSSPSTTNTPNNINKS